MSVKWRIRSIESTQSNLKFRIAQNTTILSNRQVFDLLIQSTGFIEFYNGVLADSGFKAFFWENRPVSVHNMDDLYECNLIRNKLLAGQSPDPHTFENHFRKEQRVVSFMNLGGDARLIVPCPAKNHPGYAHIGSFVRTAGSGHIRAFWEYVASAMLNSLDESPRWLSTSGLGVSWLHARIDTKPKYYQTEEYVNV